MKYTGTCREKKAGTLVRRVRFGEYTGMSDTFSGPPGKLFFFSPDGTSITFVFDPRRFDLAATDARMLRSLYVCGSFNNWLMGAGPDPSWQLLSGGGDDVLTCTVPTARVRVPGNSGQPEFLYLATGEDGSRLELTPAGRREGEYHLRNNLILFPGDDPAYLATRAREAGHIKTLADFDLSSAGGRQEIANFRRVPGVSALFRSYHPYKKSRVGLETEDARSRIVKELLAENGIASVICLCGEEEPDPELGEEICAYQRAVIRAGNQYYTDTSYEAAYYDSAGPEFGQVFAGIVRFILDHPAPYLVHCRLGSDRTGVVSALLALLGGADWETVASDYEKTGRTGIGEVRDSRLLRYSLSRLAGCTPDLSFPPRGAPATRADLVRHFVRQGYLSGRELDKLAAKLSGRSI